MNARIEIKWKDRDIPESTRTNWQAIVNLLAQIFEIPAALIMRVQPPEIEVFVASRNDGNPYQEGSREELMGLYCTHVMQTGKRLLLPNARKDPKWENNPDVKLNMISYLGYPIRWPDGSPFGTLCVLDSKENPYSSQVIEILKHFRTLIEEHLLYLEKMEELKQLENEMHNLKKLIAKCSYCGGVKNSDGLWQSFERFLRNERGISITHGICPECAQKEIDKLEEMD